MKSFKTENTVSFYFSKRETMQSNIRLTTAGSIYPGFLFTEYNGIDRNRYGAYLAEHCTPVSIEQVRLFAL